MILIDTSGLVAAVDPRQEHHAAAAQVLIQPQRRILSPFVLAEIDYLISSYAGQGEELKFLSDVAHGAYEVAPFDQGDVADAIRIIQRYGALGLGLTDASIVVLAQRYNCRDILTLDQRHFRAIHESGPEGFRLLPLDAGER